MPEKEVRNKRFLMEQKNTFERINPLFVIHPLVVGLILLAVGMFLLKSGIKRQDMIMAGTAGFGIFVGTVFTCIAMVYAFILLYRMWSIIQDGNVRTTPEKAVGFLFIPLFNFYWIFVVYYGLAVDFNRYVVERKFNISLLSIPLFLATCILPIASLLPYVMYVAFPVNIVVDIIVLFQMLTRYNALVEKKLK
jgi:uncharacterized membrane protein